MRTIRIEFHGYKRLADTSCNTDGKMIAFLGPNEAGKSSVLDGLAWLSAGGALEPRHYNRTSGVPEGWPAVRARFELSDDDRRAVEEVAFLGRPTHLTVSRYPNGTLRSRLEPQLKLDPARLDGARTALDELRASADRFDPEDAQVAVLVTSVDEALANPDDEWDTTRQASWDALVAWLRREYADGDDKDGVLRRLDLECVEALEKARGVLENEHPHETVRKRLLDLVPEFVLFSAGDRDLRSEYDLQDADLRANPPRALANLLQIAELDLEALWVQMSVSDIASARTAERRANTRLAQRLGPKWRQEQIQIQLNLSGTILEVQVSESSADGADTPISERSDGLRMFVALVAFLARRGFETPPVLLVDEAETHLHYDAQADLVEVLANDVEATQVFYTTHSPGCLPRDLGTGIRLVTPVDGRRDASELRNDFWTNARPGFTPLLFAMGAGAAAFSAFRFAVLTEGAADMILLPSLIRRAAKVDDLPYQVAPGIANHHGSGLELEETAARVVYLVDGDEGGLDHVKNLRDIGIDESRIFKLGAAKATEDYVERSLYLSVVNDLLRSRGVSLVVTPADLESGLPVSSAVARFCKTHGVDAPGKPAVAARLVGDPSKLEIDADAAQELNDIHERMLAAFAPATGPAAR